jgi:hypothetical protein
VNDLDQQHLLPLVEAVALEHFFCLYTQLIKLPVFYCFGGVSPGS